MIKRNQLVGLILLRSEIEFKEVKKNQATQKGLNNIPMIFLTANQLDIAASTAVGFFINTRPCPDKPKTFTNSFKQFMNQFNAHIKFQMEYGPICAPNNRVSVFKLMITFKDKEEF